MVQTRGGTDTMAMTSDEFKAYMDSHFDQLMANLATKDDLNSLRNDFSSLLTKLEQQEETIERNAAVISEQANRIQILEAQNEVLCSHVEHILAAQENQEQYSRRLCLRIDRMECPTSGESETSEEVLGKVQEIFKEMNLDIPDAVIDRAHRIGQTTKNDDGKVTQQVIVRFTTWRHRTAVYRARKEAKSVKFRLDLTKKRFSLLLKANEMLKPHAGWYAFSDVNCRLKAKIADEFKFFDTEEELANLITKSS